MRGMSSTSVRFGRDGELEAAQAAAAAAGLSFNAWVRRACVRQAELERSLAAQEVAEVVGPVRMDVPVPVARHTVARAFTPDFGARLKGK